jgi:hypothetical protein
MFFANPQALRILARQRQQELIDEASERRRFSRGRRRRRG